MNRTNKARCLSKKTLRPPACGVAPALDRRPPVIHLKNPSLLPKTGPTSLNRPGTKSVAQAKAAADIKPNGPIVPPAPSFPGIQNGRTSVSRGSMPTRSAIKSQIQTQRAGPPNAGQLHAKMKKERSANAASSPTPAAPPVYRPLPLPKCLQTKSATLSSIRQRPFNGQAVETPVSARPQNPPTPARQSVINKQVNRFGSTFIAQRPRGASGKAIVQRSSDKKVSAKDLEWGGKFDEYRYSMFGKFATTDTGKSNLAMYMIPFFSLTEPVRKKIQSIKESQAVHEEGFREAHMDEPGHLPHDQIVANSLTSKQAAYYAHALGKDKTAHQFIEYHVENSDMGPAFRLLYDYINDTFYITTTHYNAWEERNKEKTKRNPFYKVSFVMKPVKIKAKSDAKDKSKD